MSIDPSRFPPVLRKMHADGVTRYGASRDEWGRTWKERSLENPPALLMAFGQVEWMQPDDLEGHEPLEDWKPELGLTPFAQNGAGDLWCIHESARDGDRVPVSFVPHDEMKATIYAPDFEAFLFRQLLEAFSEIDPRGDGFSTTERAQSARAEIKTLTPYVRKAWLDVLSEVASRPVKVSKHGYHSFLTRPEAQTLVKSTLAYPRLDETFSYSNDG